MIVIAAILLVYSIINFIGVFTYKEEDNNYSNLPISKEIIESIGRGWIGIASLCGILCAMFILFV